MKRVALLALAAMLVAACGDRNPVAPPMLDPPDLGIYDGNNEGGNPDFFFLPPLVPDPSGNAAFDANGFNASVKPVVHICRLGDPNPNDLLTEVACVGTLVVFSGSQIALSSADQQFHVNWHTDETGELDLLAFYRIRVLLGATISASGDPQGGIELGFADVDPVTKGQIRNVDTDLYVPLVDGRTLPIKFRVEDGASCEDAGAICAEGTFSNAGGQLTLVPEGESFPVAGVSLPNDWFPRRALAAGITEVLIRLEDVSERRAEEAGCHPQLVALYEDGRCIRFTTEPDLMQYAEQDESGEFVLDETGNRIVFNDFVIVGICPTLGSASPLFELLDPFRSLEDGSLPTRLAATRAAFLPCDPTNPVIGRAGERPDGLLGYAAAGWQAVTGRLARMLTPRSAYALDLGVGAKTLLNSYYSFAITGSAAEEGGLQETYDPGAEILLKVRLTSTGSHVEADGGDDVGVPLPVPTADVVFSVALGGGSLRLPVGEGEAVPEGAPTVTAKTNAFGIAEVYWTLGGGGEAGDENRVLATADAEGSPVQFSTSVAPPPSPATTVSGTVMTADGQPATSTRIGIVGSVVAVFTNSAGSYSLPVPAGAGSGGTVQISVSKIGYVTQTVPVELTGGTVDRDFVLQPAIAIDGILSEPEWATAEFFDFAVSVPEGGTTPARLFMRRTATDLHIALRITRAFDSGGGSFALEFDESGTGQFFVPGQDVVVMNPSTAGVYRDIFRYACQPPEQPANVCSYYDEEEAPYATSPLPLGAKDGAGAFQIGGGFWTYEMVKPLASADDTHDFSLVEQQVVSIRMDVRVSGQAGLAGTDVNDMRFRVATPLQILGIPK